MTMIFCSNTVPADSSLAAHKTFRQKVINFISALPFTILLGFGANVACANEWAIKEFEVVEVSPLNPWIIEQLATSVPSEFTGLADELAEVLRQLPVDMETWGATPPAGQEIMQGNLKITAYFLESMGFPEPKLEPVIDFGGQGKKYRIFLMTGFKVGGDEVAGVYNQENCYDSIVFGVNSYVLGSPIIALNTNSTHNGERLTQLGLGTLSHELFHAVQFNSPLYDRHCTIGPSSWITEGTARAIGVDIARTEVSATGVDSVSIDRELGGRSYANPLHLATNNQAYSTSSFWRFLAEYHAYSRNQRPLPTAAPGAVNYEYLVSFFGQSSSDLGDTVNTRRLNELKLLDRWMWKTYPGKGLRELYTLFVAAVPNYIDYRIRNGQLPTAQIKQKWIMSTFGDCPTLTLNNTDAGSRKNTLIFDLFDVSAACFRIKLEDFPGQTVPVMAEIEWPDAEMLTQITAGSAVNDESVRTETRAMVDPDGKGGYKTRFTFPFTNDKEGTFVFANVAPFAGDTKSFGKKANIPVTFTALREYASMGIGEGWSSVTSADIDSPMPIELDRFGGHVFRGPHRQEGDQFISTQFTKGIDRPCLMVFDHLSNSETGDKVWFRMIQSGAITPGVYNFEDGTKIKDSFRITESDVPGFFLGGFQMGKVDPVLGGEVKYYTIKLGTLTIDSVAAGLVRGSLAAHGVETEYSKITGKEEEIDTKQIAVKFSIMATDPRGGPYRDQPYACLDDRARKTSQTSKGGGQPPGVKPDPETPSEPESSTGQGGFPPSDDDLAGTQGESQGKDTAEGGKAPASGGGNITDRQGNWMHVTTTGTDVTERLIADEEFHPIGVCNDKTPFSLALVKDGMPGRGFYGVSFDTEGIVPSGATGKFEVKNIKWDWGSIPPPGQPEDFPMRVSRKFAGPGTLILKRHDGAMKNSRLEGSVQSGLLVESTGSGRVALKATFGFDMNCN